VVLADLTEKPLGRAWAGRCSELTLDELRVEDGRPARLRFRGQLTGVALDDLAVLMKQPHSGGQVDLWVKSADLTPDGVPPWSSKPRVYLYRTKEEYGKATGQPGWTAGASRYVAGKTLISASIHSWQTCPRLLKSVFPHELTHLVFSGALPNRDSVPRAIHEGIAVYEEPDYRRRYFASRLGGENWIPLQQLLMAREYPHDPDLFYAEGFALVQSLIATRGMDAFLKACRAMGPGTVEKEVLKLTGYEDIESLDRDLKARFAPAPVK
jgi:hypothetical protein